MRVHIDGGSVSEANRTEVVALGRAAAFVRLECLKRVVDKDGDNGQRLAV